MLVQTELIIHTA